jgi:hypothetical protein
MVLQLSEIFSLSILLAALIALVRYRGADAVYLPFLLLVWMGAVNEIVSITLMHTGHHTAINNNLYVLGEAVLVLWLFQRLQAPHREQQAFPWLLISYAVVWSAENFWLADITRISFYFRIYYSVTIVILSINWINYLLFHERGNLLRSPSFLISACFIVFFTYKILVEVFWIYGLNNTAAFRNRVYALMVFLNLAVNLVFALVTLWIPKKQKPLLFY